MISNRHFSRRSFIKTLGTAAGAAPFVTTGLMAQPPSKTVRHASFGASNQAGRDIFELTKFPEVQLVAVAEVDLARTQRLKERFPDVKIYQDWRKLFDAEAKNIDSVNVSTPDHMHASIALTAMRLGKHVYCQKPLAHNLHEVRVLTDFTHTKSVVTQMGIHIHSTSYYRMASRLVQSGVIGKVKEVHCWCPKSWGDPTPQPNISDTPPKDFDWDLWLGVCAQRPFIGQAYYHPQNWRKRLDFGTGTFGDMGCHIFDPVFSALGLSTPISVRSEGPAPNQWNWAIDSHIEYVFPGTQFTASKTLPVTWYDGNAKPRKEILDLLEGDEAPNTGSILVGTEGTLVIPHVNHPMLYPDSKFKDYKYPEIPNGDHYGEFVQASRGLCLTSTPLSYSGPLTEAVLLGGIASRFPKATLKWNSRTMSFNEAAANRFVQRDYRQGWQIKGLG
jgi:predicted dehydrogenase